MRFGRLLAEDSPTALIETYQQSNLENVFLSLCMKTGDDEDEADSSVSVVTDDLSKPSVTMCQPMAVKDEPVCNKKSKFGQNFQMGGLGEVCYDLVQWTRLKALLVKNFIRMWRNLGFLVFQFIIPTVQVSLFCLAIGREPKGMTVAVVNEEVGGGSCLSWSDGCLLAGRDLMEEEDDDEDGWSDWNVSEPDFQQGQVSAGSVDKIQLRVFRISVEPT